MKYVSDDYTSFGCLLVFIMSHGDKSKIISSDSKEIDLNEFITPLKRNATLISKPKIFFIQACRGNNKMTADGKKRPSSSNSIVHERYFDDKNRLPKEADFLVSYSTLEGNESYRDEDDGTWYIQMLCKAVREEESKEISAILTYTHYLVANMVGKHRFPNGETVELKMMPMYENRLLKLFYIAKPKNVRKKFFFLFYITIMTLFLHNIFNWKKDFSGNSTRNRSRTKRKRESNTIAERTK